MIGTGDEFKVLGKNPLEAMALASPAIAGDRLLVRTRSRLYCIQAETSP